MGEVINLELRTRLLRRAGIRARRAVEDLSIEFARAASEEKETLLAAIEFERWMADACDTCLAQDDETPRDSR
jgi:uncharacterized membrane protein